MCHLDLGERVKLNIYDASRLIFEARGYGEQNRGRITAPQVLFHPVRPVSRSIFDGPGLSHRLPAEAVAPDDGVPAELPAHRVEGLVVTRTGGLKEATSPSRCRAPPCRTRSGRPGSDASSSAAGSGSAGQGDAR